MPQRLPPMSPGDLVVATCDVFLWGNKISTSPYRQRTTRFPGGTPFLLLRRDGNTVLLLHDGAQWVGDRLDFKRVKEREKK